MGHIDQVLPICQRQLRGIANFCQPERESRLSDALKNLGSRPQQHGFAERFDNVYRQVIGCVLKTDQRWTLARHYQHHPRRLQDREQSFVELNAGAGPVDVESDYIVRGRVGEDRAAGFIGEAQLEPFRRCLDDKRLNRADKHGRLELRGFTVLKPADKEVEAHAECYLNPGNQSGGLTVAHQCLKTRPLRSMLTAAGCRLAVYPALEGACRPQSASLECRVWGRDSVLPIETRVMPSVASRFGAYRATHTEWTSGSA